MMLIEMRRKTLNECLDIKQFIPIHTYCHLNIICKTNTIFWKTPPSAQQFQYVRKINIYLLTKLGEFPKVLC